MVTTLRPTLLAFAAAAAFPGLVGAAADAPKFSMKTYTYKTVGPTEIKADVYRAEDAAVRPVLVWIHGGALIVGSRSGVPKDLLDLCRDEGFILVSIDYRLAPETKLPAIVEDLEDAFAWVRARGPGLFHADPSRLVVAGGSAGGYLTLLAGARVKPRPRALVAYWGYGALDNEWYTKPSEHYRKSAPLVDQEEAYRAVGKGVPTGADGEAGKARGKFYLYCRQNGLWPREVAGFGPDAGRAAFDPYCPVRNVTADYPPTLLVHGTVDTDVPYGESEAMAAELARHKVPHELITVRGGGHGLGGGDRKVVEDALARARAFVRKHLQEPSEGK